MHSRTTGPDGAGSSTVGIAVGVVLSVGAVFMVAVLILVLGMVLILKHKRKLKHSPINTGTVGLCSCNSDIITLLQFPTAQHRAVLEVMLGDILTCHCTYMLSSYCVNECGYTVPCIM